MAKKMCTKQIDMQICPTLRPLPHKRVFKYTLEEITCHFHIVGIEKQQEIATKQ